MKYLSLLFVPFTSLMLSCSNPREGSRSVFVFTENEQGIALAENGNPVFFYRKAPKTLTGQYICSNYIHPLYGISGDTLTEEFPPDHPYHRGIFWTWHQLYADGKSIGDGWINEGISQDVVSVKTEAGKDRAQINTGVMWKSAILPEGKPFMEEHTTITVHKLTSDIRRIDFSITLKALVPALQIGGSADAKGYGGFCARIKLPDGIVFTSENGPVTPQELQIKAGPWMDFSTSSVGMTILCHPATPGYPEPWILRQKGSMQNVVFPGQEMISLPMDKPVTLHYRILVHRGDASTINIPELQSEYGKIHF
jgi:hypothetical protein